MPGWGLRPPADLVGYQLELGGDSFVLLEWGTTSPCIEAFAAAHGLTDAEREVLEGIVRGDSNEAIARRRQRRLRTVANQVASIFRKVGVHSRV